MTDWLAWQRGYDDPASPLSQRLSIVQHYADAALRGMAAGPTRVLSLCAVAWRFVTRRRVTKRHLAAQSGKRRGLRREPIRGAG